MIGFTMFGVVNVYWLFVAAVVVITIGEMIVVPTSQTLAMGFAPEEKRGRYMGMFGVTWSIPATIGPGAAGLILDNLNPDLLWYIGGALCLVSVLAYYALHLRLGRQERFQPAPEEPAAV
jgi:MFS family permease